MLLKVAVFGLLFIVTSCNRHTTSAYYNWETIFVKSEFNGSEIYKYYGAGKNKSESVHQAEVDVLKALIFKGISGSPDSRPLLFEVNAEEKYRSYFASFFEKGGEYKNFVELYKNGNLNNNDRLKTGKRNDRKKKGIEIIVKRAELRRTLESAKIIPLK